MPRWLPTQVYNLRGDVAYGGLWPREIVSLRTGYLVTVHGS